MKGGEKKLDKDGSTRLSLDFLFDKVPDFSHAPLEEIYNWFDSEMEPILGPETIAKLKEKVKSSRGELDSSSDLL